MIEPKFGGQNWLITPAARAVNEAAPASISDQKWLLVLSGVAIIDILGKTAVEWNRATVHIVPHQQGPLDHAINRFSIPRPPGEEGMTYSAMFQAEQWSPFATISSIFDENQSVNAGFAVDKWRLAPFFSGSDAFSGQEIRNIFSGVLVDVAVRDTDAWLYRIGYNITLLGKIVFVNYN